MATVTRALAESQFDNNVAVFSADAVSYVGLFTNISFGIQTDTKESRAAVDFDDWVANGASGMSLSFSKVVESGLLPLVAIALSADPTIAVIFRHSRTGENYAGTFLITNARWETGEGAQSESVTAVLQGDITRSLPAISAAATPRTTQADSSFGDNVASVLIGTDDYYQVFTDLSISVDIQTQEAMAALDNVKYPVASSRRTTVTVSKVVQAHATVPTSALPFMELARARAAVAVVITAKTAGNTITFTNSGLCTDANTEVSGAQRESLTVVCRGAAALT